MGLCKITIFTTSWMLLAKHLFFLFRSTQTRVFNLIEGWFLGEDWYVFVYFKHDLLCFILFVSRWTTFTMKDINNQLSSVFCFNVHWYIVDTLFWCLTSTTYLFWNFIHLTSRSDGINFSSNSASSTFNISMANVWIICLITGGVCPILFCNITDKDNKDKILK